MKDYNTKINKLKSELSTCSTHKKKHVLKKLSKIKKYKQNKKVRMY